MRGVEYSPPSRKGTSPSVVWTPFGVLRAFGPTGIVENGALMVRDGLQEGSCLSSQGDRGFTLEMSASNGDVRSHDLYSEYLATMDADISSMPCQDVPGA